MPVDTSDWIALSGFVVVGLACGWIFVAIHPVAGFFLFVLAGIFWTAVAGELGVLEVEREWPARFTVEEDLPLLWVQLAAAVIAVAVTYLFNRLTGREVFGGESPREGWSGGPDGGGDGDGDGDGD